MTLWAPAPGPLGQGVLPSEQRTFPVQLTLAAVCFQHLVELLPAPVSRGLHEVQDLQMPLRVFFTASVPTPGGVSSISLCFQVPSGKLEAQIPCMNLNLNLVKWLLPHPDSVSEGKLGWLLLQKLPKRMVFPLDTPWGKLVPAAALPLFLMCRWKKWPKGHDWESVLGRAQVPGFLCGAQPRGQVELYTWGGQCRSCGALGLGTSGCLCPSAWRPG